MQGTKPSAWLGLAIVNQMSKVFFKLNTIRNVLSTFSSFDNIRISVDHFPLDEQVTYAYFKGRVEVYQEHYVRCASSDPSSLAVIPACRTFVPATLRVAI